MKTDRLRELDSLRGLAALIVLFHHDVMATGLLWGQRYDIVLNSPLRVLVLGRPAVLFFFVLSGFVLTRALASLPLNATTLLRWVMLRSVRLMLPALGALLVSAALYELTIAPPWPEQTIWMRDAVWTSPPGPGAIARQAALVAPEQGYGLDNVLWSLAIEWRLSVLLPLIAIPVVFKTRDGTLTLLFGAIGVACLAGGGHPDVTDVGRTFLGAVRSSAYFALPFVIGAVMTRLDPAALPVSRARTVAAGLAIVGLARAGTDLAVYVASGLLIWLAMQEGVVRRFLRWPALTWLGTISFSLYLVHVPLVSALQHLLHDRLSKTVLFGLCAAIAIPSGWAFHALVERPAQRVARRLSNAVRIGRFGRQPDPVSQTSGAR